MNSGRQPGWRLHHETQVTVQRGVMAWCESEQRRHWSPFEFDAPPGQRRLPICRNAAEGPGGHIRKETRMKATECLNIEHGVFLTQLEVLEGFLRDGAPDEVLRGILLTVAAAVEKHRDNEELNLYPALTEAFGGHCPPIPVMELEHNVIGRCIDGIAARRGNTRELVTAFLDTLRGHIAKEMEVLFPMAEQNLAPGMLEEMAARSVRPSPAPQAAGGGGCGSCGHA